MSNEFSSNPSDFRQYAHLSFPDGLSSSGKETHWGGYDRRRRSEQADRPKSKVSIPGCEPWALVKTKLGRRFVHNPELGTSFWRFPANVMRNVIEYDRLERERKAGERAIPEVPVNDGAAAPEAELLAETGISTAAQHPSQTTVTDGMQPLVDSEGEEYEEVEVTDDEGEENPKKRQRTASGDPEAPVEFNEDDIAYQLAAMGQDYGLEPGEYDNGEDGNDLEEGAEGLPLTEEDSSALFKDMLNDHHISPYSTWDKLIELGQIVEDDRYTVLPNMKTRKEIFADWSRENIQRLKGQRAREEKKDPRIPYYAFLELKATPKLYWPEFRRKYQKEPEMKNSKLSDKDREKAYREYINRLKLPEITLKADLVSLLKSMPPQVLNRSSTLDALPAALLTDLRHISLRSSIRAPLVEAHISNLAPAPVDVAFSHEEQVARSKEKKERERREQALSERQRKVEEEKRKQKGDLYRSKGMLREEEEEVQRAMRVGKEGLLGHMQPDEEV